MPLTRTSSQTLVFDFVDGKCERLFPCRCGETHRGDYAFEDWNHHNCFHDSPLVVLEPGVQLICMDCGETFVVEGWDAVGGDSQ